MIRNFFLGARNVVIKGLITPFYWYYLIRQKNNDNDEINKRFMILRNLLLSFKLTPIMILASELSTKRNAKLPPEIIECIIPDGFDRVTSIDTYHLLRGYNSEDARKVIMKFFPKQIDFDVLVKHLENCDAEKFEAEVAKRRNDDFYTYCGVMKAFEDIQGKTKEANSNTFAALCNPSNVSEKTIKAVEKCDQILIPEISDGIKESIDYDPSNIESIVSTVKNRLNIIAYYNDDLSRSKRKKMYKLLNDPFVKSHFADGCEYFEACIEKIKKINIAKRTTKSINTKPTHNTGDPSFRSMLIGSEEERDAIIAKLKKYIDDKGKVAGAGLAQLVIAANELGWLITPDNTEDFHREMVYTFGEKLGGTEALRNNLKEYEIFVRLLDSNDYNNDLYNKAKVNRRRIDDIKAALMPTKEQQ